MKFSINFYLVLLILSNNILIAQDGRPQDPLFNKIDDYFEAGTEHGFSGAIAVVKNGELLINKGYGLADRDQKVQINPNTVFDIGSNTKQFTATAILKLFEMGKLNLDDTLEMYFKSLPSDKQNISIHHLLCHTSGLQDAVGKDFDEISTEEFFRSVFSSQLMTKPGEKYAYSNIGYSILGRIIELVSEENYEDFLAKYLFEPAGMQNTGYLLPKWNSIEVAKSYNRGILEGVSPVYKYSEQGAVSWNLKANGGINSSQNDMLLWYKAMKNNLIISKESFTKLSTPYAEYPNSELSYAYGWNHRIIDGSIKRIAHNGSNGAYAHSIIWFPGEDTFISYATNANSEKVEYIAYNVAKLVLDETFAPKPIKNNVYAYSFDFMRENSTDKSSQFITALKKNYPDKFTDSSLLNSLGNLLLMMNESPEWSLELFKCNVASYPDDGNLWDSLGDAYMAMNQKEEAIESYKKAVKLGYDKAQQKLKDLIKS
jgi:CubicO group peptidase (beta-lactamase class C family)